jgi:Zinc binding domain
MSDCCASNNPKSATLVCPRCATVCKPVGMRTLYHQVRFPENQQLVSRSYYFCPSKGCPTAYFSTLGNNIPKQQLTTYQDIQNDKLCYCFDIDTTDYLTAFNNNAETIKNFVIERTKSDECACEIRNPSGQCCLSKFKALQA